MTDSVEVRDLPDRITVRNEVVEVISAGTMGPASLAVGSVIGADGEIVQYVGTTPVASAHRAHTGITVAASDSPAWMKRMADYTCDGTADQVQWQAAIDEAQTYISASSTGVPPVRIMPGTYFLANEIMIKSAAVVAYVPGGYSVMVCWQGTDGVGTAFTKNDDYPGGASFWNFSGFEFGPGTGNQLPDIWLDLSDGTLDAFCGLNYLHFRGGRIQIKVGYWVNAHWSHLWFHGWSEYAIQLNPTSNLNQSSFHLSDFAADNNSNGLSSGSSKGFLNVNKPVDGSHYGIIRLSDARIEFNEPLHATTHGMVVITDSGTDGDGHDPGDFLLVVDGVNFQNSADTLNTPVLFMQTARTNGQQNYDLMMTAGGVTDLFGGTWFSRVPLPTMPASGFIHMSNVARYQDGDNAQLNFPTTNLDASSLILASRISGWGYNQYEIDKAGVHRWFGAFGSAYDTNLYRNAANELKTDDKFTASLGITGGSFATGSRPTASTAGAGTMIYDTTLSKPIWSNGTVWKDAAGTTV